MRYAFADPTAEERHETQYFEMFGNRGIYHKGWTAVTRHKTPWMLVGEDVPAFDDDVWELYDTSVDWTQFEDLAGRPTLIKGNRQRIFGGMGRLSESSIVNIKNKSHAVTAEIDVFDDGVQGVIIAQGGSIGGWTLYAKTGRLRYCYNLLGVHRFYVDSEREIPTRRHQVRMEFDYDGPGFGKGGIVSLYLDGEQVGQGPVAATAAMIFSADDTCDVGKEGGALVADDYPTPNAFTGDVNWVEIDVGDAAADADHQLDPDELLRVAMARQ
jgi:arylsulfatase